MEKSSRAVHCPEGKCAHLSWVTTWLDPIQAIAQAEAIRDALVDRRPENAAGFDRQFDLLAADLVELDRALAEAVSELASSTIFFSHPVYQYLSRRYGIKEQAVHWEPHTPPTPDQWGEFTGLLSEHPSQLMVWEGMPDTQTREDLKALGLQIVIFEPVATQPDEGDYLSKMNANVDRLINVAVAD